jgi:serine protease AprX
MATGVTSGAIADLLQAVPNLTPDAVKALVMVNGNRSYFPQTSSVTADGVVYNANYDVFTIGAGYLDILKAVNGALLNGGSVPAGTAMSPIATYNTSNGDVTAVTDETALWGKTGPWSASSVYGSNAFISSESGESALRCGARAIPMDIPHSGARQRSGAKVRPKRRLPSGVNRGHRAHRHPSSTKTEGD